MHMWCLDHLGRDWWGRDVADVGERACLEFPRRGAGPDARRKRIVAERRRMIVFLLLWRRIPRPRAGQPGAQKMQKYLKS